MRRFAHVTSAGIAFTAVALVLLWCGQAAGQAKAITLIDAEPDSLTVAELDRAARQMWQPRVVDSYRQAAEPGDPSHNQIITLLERVAHRLTDARQAPAWEAIEAEARELLDAGVDDPHVRGWYAHALAVRGAMADAEPHARAAADALLKEDDEAAAPLLLRAITAQRMAWIYNNTDQADRGETYRERAAHLYVRALAEELPDDPLQQRAMLRWVREDAFDQLSPDDQQLFFERCIDHGVDAWVTNLLRGVTHLRLGREITRKHGHGPHPLERGAAYHRHMTDARRYLLEAHDLHPDRPEPASWLITLSALGYAPAGTTSRNWFNHAVEAQLDHIPAYTRMIDALHPHRAGSRDDLLNFGIACLMTERFDTEVPYQFFRVVEEYAELLGGDYPRAFGQEGVAEKLQWMLEGYRAQPDRRDERAWFDSFIAAVAWRSGDIQRAGHAMRLAGDDLHVEAFERVGAVPERAIGEIVARTGEFARITEDLQRLVDSGEHEIAIIELEALADRQEGRPALRRFFLHQAQQASMARDLRFGAEADLTPGKDLAGWSPMVGEWSVDNNGTLIGRSTEKGLWIECDVPLGTNFELTAEFDLAADTIDERPNAGIYFGHRADEGFHTFFAYHDSGTAQLGRGLWAGTETDAPVRLMSNLRLVVRDRRVYAYVNGRPVFHNQAPRQLTEDDTARVGLGGRYNVDGAVVRFRNIRARRIEQSTLSHMPPPDAPPAATSAARDRVASSASGSSAP